MMDAEDRDFVLMWAIRSFAAVLGIFGGALTLGLAWRVFEIVRG